MLDSSLIFSILNDILEQDEDLYWHCIHTATTASRIVHNLKYNASECQLLWFAGALHDYGKLYVPKTILYKPDRLTDFEYKIVESHAIIGVNILAERGIPESILSIIAEHHEAHGGGGYPVGKPFLSNYGEILAIADKFSALTSKRVYKSAMHPVEAYNILKENNIFREDLLNGLLEISENSDNYSCFV